ncbi:hypothetical protein HD806DRAFT_541601 [Xylariaceae sp. AK1471]|nr:hypothetical protein HD806DRAFT_541601 [Xylariaceae sp. AK1471]
MSLEVKPAKTLDDCVALVHQRQQAADDNTPQKPSSAEKPRIEHYLREKYSSRERQTPKILIASYFFPGLRNKKQDDTGSTRTTLKCMAVQLAEQYDSFVRILISAKPSSFQTQIPVPFLDIDIEEHNLVDIERYSNRKLKVLGESHHNIDDIS